MDFSNILAIFGLLLTIFLFILGTPIMNFHAMLPYELRESANLKMGTKNLLKKFLWIILTVYTILLSFYLYLNRIQLSRISSRLNHEPIFPLRYFFYFIVILLFLTLSIWLLIDSIKIYKDIILKTHDIKIDIINYELNLLDKKSKLEENNRESILRRISNLRYSLNTAKDIELYYKICPDNIVKKIKMETYIGREFKEEYSHLFSLDLKDHFVDFGVEPISSIFKVIKQFFQIINDNRISSDVDKEFVLNSYLPQFYKLIINNFPKYFKQCHTEIHNILLNNQARQDTILDYYECISKNDLSEILITYEGPILKLLQSNSENSNFHQYLLISLLALLHNEDNFFLQEKAKNDFKTFEKRSHLNHSDFNSSIETSKIANHYKNALRIKKLSDGLVPS